MISIVAKITASSGKETEMEELLCGTAAKVNANKEDALVYVIQRKLDDPCVFLVYEQYRDVDHIEKIHRQTPYYKALFSALGSLTACPPEVERYEILQ
jgi:quinol monooxygenase YgiN